VIDRARVVIVSGIPAGPGGTGRLVGHLVAEAKDRGVALTLVAKPERLAFWRLVLLWRQKKHREAIGRVIGHAQRYVSFLVRIAHVMFVDTRTGLVLLHPQNLGFGLALALIARRRGTAILYLLDSSFFCVASYNYVRGEVQPCLRCLGGHFDAIADMNCKPFPRSVPAALDYVKALKSYVAAGKLQLLAQTPVQAQLAQRHFGLPEAPRSVGLWTEDWNELFEHTEQDHESTGDCRPTWDFVFHGYPVGAKGAHWWVDVARHCESMKFLFPFPKPVGFEAPSNCDFRGMSWETGLREAIESAWCTAVPSLWSAPVEGALVKSLAVAARVAVVENDTSFSAEIPDDLVIRLPRDPKSAATAIRDAKARQWAPDPQRRVEWLRAFAGRRSEFFGSLIEAAQRPQY
jgi:hypothetical protein